MALFLRAFAQNPLALNLVNARRLKLRKRKTGGAQPFLPAEEQAASLPVHIVFPATERNLRPKRSI